METSHGDRPSSTYEPAFSTLDSREELHVKGYGQRNSKSHQPGQSSARWTTALVGFGPSWFAVTQCTGVVSVVLNRVPYNGHWLYWLSVVIFALNVFLFTAFTLIMCIRFLAFRRLFISTLKHETEPFFFGCYPMSLATIIQMLCFVCYPAWGSWVVNFAWAFWWIDVVLSLACSLILPYLSFTVHEIKDRDLTAAWLLPVISSIVCAAAGGTVTTTLTHPDHALWTILVSYILLGLGLMLSFIIVTIYYYRLLIYKNPPKDRMFTVFLPLGPLGQGGFAFQQLGENSLKTFPMTHTLNAMAGQIFYAGGYLVALLMWGFGLAWLFFAIASVCRGRTPFNMTWWSSIFPLGVYTMSTIQMGMELPSSFFKVLGTIFGVATTLLWLLVSAKTLQHCVKGTIFSNQPHLDYRARHIFKKPRRIHSTPSEASDD